MPKTIRPFPKPHATPRRDIHYLLGQTHVGTPMRVVIRDVVTRCRKTGKFDRSNLRATIRYAVLVHKQNRRLYRQVSAGYFGDIPLEKGLR